ncbi:Lsr2 family DNA-binding protein [Arthrobacter pityocampae]|uniref:Lsr2 family DNA-binding protein n=1 Tax=Arthrobacter pityocampae TaxID=547334 RepID=UPI0037354661
MSRALDTLFADLPSRLSVEQLTDVLGLSDKTVTYRWLRDGKVPAIRLGGTWVILRDDIHEHLEASYNTRPGFVGTPPPSTDEEQGSSTVPEGDIADEDEDATPEPAREDEREAAGSTPSRREELQRIRQWAQDNGFTPSSRGRISQSIVDAYNEAHK